MDQAERMTGRILKDPIPSLRGAQSAYCSERLHSIDRRTATVTELIWADGKFHRSEIWPTEEHQGLPVLLAGGEVGVLTAWRHADDRSWWQWSVEFANHTGRPDAWAPPDSKLKIG